MSEKEKQYGSVDEFLAEHSEDDLLKAANEWVKSKSRRGKYAEKRQAKTQALSDMIAAAKKDPHGEEARLLKQFGVGF